MSDRAEPAARLPPGLRSGDLRRYCCEFIGTFSLVFFAAVPWWWTPGWRDLGAIGPGLISGLVITVVIYAFGHVSAHTSIRRSPSPRR